MRVEASAPDVYGYGTRAMGMAGLNASEARGHDAVYHNPAGLLLGTTPSCAVGFSYGGQSLELNHSLIDAPKTSQTHIGGAIPLPLGGFMANRLALGFGFVVPTETVLHAYLPTPGTPHFSLVGYRTQTVTIQAAMAVRLTEDITVGAGLIALSTLEGAIDVAPNAEGRIGSSARDQLVAEYAPIIGLSWTPNRYWSFAAVHRGESQARFGLPLDANLGDNFPVPIPILRVHGTAQYDPRHSEFEVSAYQGDLRWAINLAWHEWSRFPQPVSDATRPADLPALPTPNFEDRWAVGFALETSWDSIDFGGTVRGGYRYRPTPVPDTQTVHAFLDSNRHVFALGHSLTWQMFTWRLAAQYHHMEERKTISVDQLTDAITPLHHHGSLWMLSTEIGVDL